MVTHFLIQRIAIIRIFHHKIKNINQIKLSCKFNLFSVIRSWVSSFFFITKSNFAVQTAIFSNYLIKIWDESSWIKAWLFFYWLWSLFFPFDLHSLTFVAELFISSDHSFFSSAYFSKLKLIFIETPASSMPIIRVDDFSVRYFFAFTHYKIEDFKSWVSSVVRLECLPS